MPCLLLLSALSLACGIADVQVADSSEVRFELRQTTFRSGETVEASFVNDSGETIFVISFGSCASSLQKLEGDRWSKLYVPELSCAAVVSSWPFAAGRVAHLSFSPESIERLTGELAGTYRLVWHVGLAEKREDAMQVVSRTFRIVE